MKYQPLFCLLFLLLACNDNSTEKPTPKPPQRKDTAVVNTPSQNPYANVDVSPMDVSYYPTDYPLQKMSGKASPLPVMRVIYSRPHRQGRKIFGNLLHYGEPWRLGANEATELEFFKDVTIAGKKVAKGRYTVYAIPTENKWTIILNRDTDTWGAFVYDEKKDILRTDVPTQLLTTPVDAFSMGFNKTERGMDLFIAWDNVSANLPISFK